MRKSYSGRQKWRPYMVQEGSVGTRFCVSASQYTYTAKTEMIIKIWLSDNVFKYWSPARWHEPYTR